MTAHPPLASASRSAGSVLPVLLIAILPKCPACLGAYLAFASGLGLSDLPLGPLWVAMLGATALALGLLARAAARRRQWPAFMAACAGTLIVLLGRAVDAPGLILLAGIVLLYGGALKIFVSRLTRMLDKLPCKGARCPSP